MLLLRRFCNYTILSAQIPVSNCTNRDFCPFLHHEGVFAVLFRKPVRKKQRLKAQYRMRCGALLLNIPQTKKTQPPPRGGGGSRLSAYVAHAAQYIFGTVGEKVGGLYRAYTGKHQNGIYFRFDTGNYISVHAVPHYCGIAAAAPKQ